MTKNELEVMADIEKEYEEMISRIASLEAENARLKTELAASQSTEPVFTLEQVEKALEDANVTFDRIDRVLGHLEKIFQTNLQR